LSGWSALSLSPGLASFCLGVPSPGLGGVSPALGSRPSFLELGLCLSWALTSLDSLPCFDLSPCFCSPLPCFDASSFFGCPAPCLDSPCPFFSGWPSFGESPSLAGPSFWFFSFCFGCDSPGLFSPDSCFDPCSGLDGSPPCFGEGSCPFCWFSPFFPWSPDFEG